MQRHAPTTPRTTNFARTYPGRPDQLRWVRADLAAFLYGCPATDDLLLLVTEFCANAVMHSRSGQPGGSFDVRVHVATGDHVRVEVADDGGAWSGRDHGDGRPHGLDLVEALCGEGHWGIGGGPLGRVAWARLGWHRGPDA